MSFKSDKRLFEGSSQENVWFGREKQKEFAAKTEQVYG